MELRDLWMAWSGNVQQPLRELVNALDVLDGEGGFALTHLVNQLHDAADEAHLNPVAMEAAIEAYNRACPAELAAVQAGEEDADDDL